MNDDRGKGGPMGSVMQDNVVFRAACPEDLPAVEALLVRSSLPTAGVAEWLPHFVVAEMGGGIAAVAGAEVHGEYGLLRSVAVEEEWRGRGLGRALTTEVLASAMRDGLRAVYLLTQTADTYFPRLGFRRISRGDVPEPVTHSLEFRELCPVSSTVMVTMFGATDPVEES